MKTFFKLFLFAACLPCITNAQTHLKKAVAGTTNASALKGNSIIHQIAKRGAGDHGIFYDTLANAIKPTDAFNGTGKQYQDIKVTLDAGDVVVAEVKGEPDVLTMNLLGIVNNQLKTLKPIVDTSQDEGCKIYYKANRAGTYILRVITKSKVPIDQYESEEFYESESGYTLNCIIATAAAGRLHDNPTVCEVVQFLLRQRLTAYLPITGAVIDTSVEKNGDILINHQSLFTIDKKSEAIVSTDPKSAYFSFDQTLEYKNQQAAEKAWHFLIDHFKNCLGADWRGAALTSNPNWYVFRQLDHEDINIIIYPERNLVEILM